MAAILSQPQCVKQDFKINLDNELNRILEAIQINLSKRTDVT